VIAEIDADLGRTTPMQRLLQGDGSGKTSSRSVPFSAPSDRPPGPLAPTETSPSSISVTLEPLCAQLGVRCVLLWQAPWARKQSARIANGVAQIAVSTVLIQRGVRFAVASRSSTSSIASVSSSARPSLKGAARTCYT
jgi:RecG-like helicase